MTYQQALSAIHEIPWKSKKPGLERIRELLRLMGDPQDGLSFVHIAGSNGKGSCAAMTASVLQSAGYRTGLCISPYIHRFNERMQVDGRPVGDGELAGITEYVKGCAGTMAEHPTEFEFVTAIAFEFFRRRRCDIVVLEVGLGGRLDATNVIKAPAAAAITAIGLEHTELLGGTVEKIAAEKAGIIKPGCGVVVSGQQRAVIGAIAEACREKGAELVIAQDRFELLDLTPDGQTLSLGGERYLLPLLGGHQRQNLATVLELVKLLRKAGYHIPQSALREGIASVRWPGRFEFLQKQPPFIVDGGHNPQCSRTVAKTLRELYGEPRVELLLGVLRDKDVKGIIDPLMPMVERAVTITPPSPRAMGAEQLSGLLSGGYGVKSIACTDIKSGVIKAIGQAGPGEVILAYGSLYSVGKIRECFGRND